MTALATTEPRTHDLSVTGQQMGMLDEAAKFIEELAKQGALPKRFATNKAQALAALLAARELGMETIQGISSFYVVGGQISMAADAMIARAQLAGHKVWHDFTTEEFTATIPTKNGEKTVTTNQVTATTIIVRAEDIERHMRFEDALVEESDPVKVTALERIISKLEHRISWGYEESRAAALLDSETHIKYPRAMRRHRADAECIRMVCPEVLGAYKYTPEELGARVGEDGIPLKVTAERMDRPSPKAPSHVGKVDAERESVRTEAVRAERGAVLQGEVVTPVAALDFTGLDPQGIYDRVAAAPSAQGCAMALEYAAKRGMDSKIVRVAKRKETLLKALQGLHDSLR